MSFYLSLLGFTGFYGFYLVLSDFHGFLRSFTGFYCFFDEFWPSFIYSNRFPRALQGITGFYLVLPSFTGYPIGFYLVVLGFY